MLRRSVRTWYFVIGPLLLTLAAGVLVSAPAQAVAQVSIFGEAIPAQSSDSDTATVELGVQFKVAVAKQVTGIRFYKGTQNIGTHTASLWSGSTRVAQATFSGESASGWQQVSFAGPVAVRAGQVYTASYMAPKGRYAVNNQYPFPKTSGDLTAVKGVYRYGGGYPTDVYQSSNYWVDVVVGAAPVTPPTSSTTQKPPATTTAAPTTAAPTTAAPTTLPSSQWPDATNTGATGTLSRVVGGTNITTAGQVVENKEFTGQVTVQADNVTLRNVRIVTGDFWVILNQGKNLTLVNCTLIGGNGTQASIGDNRGGYFNGLRLNISGAGDGLKMGAGSQLRDSYVHDLATFAGAHNDGIEITSAPNVKVVHNTILNQNGQTSAIMISEFGSNPNSGVLVQGNLLAGGGFTIYGGAPDTAMGHQVINNVFSKRFFPRSGYYGFGVYWSKAGNTWSGNTWEDGTPVPTP